MTDQGTILIEKIEAVVKTARASGGFSREQLMAAADRIHQWKRENQIAGIWNNPPLMVTATLDDGLGQGLELIHHYAGLLGMRLSPMGLLKTPEAIIEHCRAMRPSFLGLTVLQFDSEQDLATIGRQIPDETKLIAGGPVFLSDPDMADRTNVYYVAKDVLSFTTFMLGNATRGQ